MSRLAKKPVPLPDGVEVKLGGAQLVISGDKGALPLSVPFGVKVRSVDGAVRVEGGDSRLVGLTVALLRNAIQGVSEGFKKELELVGVGYRAAKEGDVLKLSLGFSHPIEYPIREGVTITVTDGTRVVIEGADKRQVGQVAAEIRRFRPPEPYKGKGIRYSDEVIRKKLGKAAKVGVGTT
jgi:large subunit ribosomal protein L6